MLTRPMIRHLFYHQRARFASMVFLAINLSMRGRISATVCGAFFQVTSILCNFNAINVHELESKANFWYYTKKMNK